jgi:RNA 2',3'-cyclic 3'-phosphodiesterase
MRPLCRWQAVRVRLFVGILPPGAVLDEVAGLRRPEHPGVRWTTRDQWHATLRFLGEVPDPAPVAAALDAAPLAPASAVLGPEVTSLGRRVVCVPVAGLDDLAAGVVAATAGFGRPPEPRPFHGHLTLARVTRGSLRDLVGEPISARFRVRAVRLVRSRLGPKGSRYDDVHVRRLH